MSRPKSDFDTVVRVQELLNPDGELAVKLDLAIADAIEREHGSKASRRVMETRFVVSGVMQSTLSQVFPEASLVFRNFEASVDGDFDALRSFLMHTLYEETLGKMYSARACSIVSISNDIYDLVTNARSQVTLCPVSASNNQRAYADSCDSRLHALYDARELSDLQGAVSGKVASIAEYLSYMRDPRHYFTSVGSRGKFDILVHDCFHSQMSQHELAFVAYSFGVKQAYFYIPYIPEVFFSLHDANFVTLPDYGLAYSVDERNDVLRVRSLNSDFVDMVYNLQSYKQMLYRKVARLGNVVATFEQRVRFGRFLCCSMTFTTLDRIITGLPEYHCVNFDFDNQIAFCRYQLKSGRDATDPRNYTKIYFMAPADAVASTRDYARKIDRDSFTPRAIRRRLASFVQRTIVGGTTLKFEDFVSSDDLTGLVNWIFAEAYITRHMSGETLKLLQKDNLRTFAMADRPILFRVYAALCGLSASVYDSTVASVLQGIHNSLAAVRLSSVKHLDCRPVDFPTGIIVCERVELNSSVYAMSLAHRRDFSSSGPLSFVSDQVAGLNKKLNAGKAVRTTVSTEMRFREVDDRFFSAITSKVEMGNDYTQASNYIGFDTTETVYQEQAPLPQHRSEVVDRVNVINDAYRSMYPDQFKHPMTVNQLIFSVSAYDLNVRAPFYELRPYNSMPYRDKAYYESKLKGPKQIPVQPTTRNIMQALNNRQMGPPDIDEAIDLSASSNEETLNVMMRRFFVSFCVPNWEQLLSQADNSFFMNSYQSLAAKLKNLDEHKVKKWMEYDGHFTDMRQNVMKCMVKSINKPPDAAGGHLKVDKTQTIIYDESYAATEFGQALDSSLELLDGIMRPQVLWMRRKRPDHIQKHAQEYDPFQPGTCYLEADISRCDKSFKQYMLITLIDELFRVLRMNVLTRYAWYTSMDAVRVRAMEAGIRFTLAGQIKSGFFSTWLCNVFGVQVSFANAFQLFKVKKSNNFDVAQWFKTPVLPEKRMPALDVEYLYHYAMATGDDGLVCLVQPPSRDERLVLRDYMSKVTNLEVKVIVSDTPYFASGYLLVDIQERLAHFVPNPIKTVEKKSYAVNASNAAWHDYWQSLHDSLASLSSSRVRKLLSDAVQRRNEREVPLMNDAIDALYAISQDESAFRELYDDEMIKL